MLYMVRLVGMGARLRVCWLYVWSFGMKEKKICARCERELEGKPFLDMRYCAAKCKDGGYAFEMFCLDCEPYPEMGEHH